MQRILILFMCLFVFACSGQSKEDLLKEGDTLRAQGNNRGAIVLYKNALEKDANFLEARSGLAEAYLASGNFAKAENEFNKILHQNPSDGSAQQKLAQVYIQQNKSQEALLELDKYHSSHAESAESLTLYGRAHGSSGDIDTAEKMFNKALQLNPDDVQASLYLAKVYLQRQENEQARVLLKKLIERDKEQVEAYYLLASIETRSGDQAAALKVYQALVAVKPKELQALYMIGMLQLDKGELDEAQKTVETILTTFKDRPEGLRLKGLLLYRQGKFEEAVPVFEASLKTQQHLLSYFFLGLSQFSLNKLELALNQFQKALDLNPDFIRARLLVAMTLLKQQRIDDSIISVQQVLRADPNNAYAHNILGSAYLAQGKYDEGMAELEVATDIDPGLSDAYLKRGIFNLAKGDGAQGEADLVKAVAAAPEVLNNRLMLVTHYLRQKNYSAAIDTLKEGMDGSETDALLNNYLAAAYFSQKKTTLAVESLNRAKKANPDYLTPYFNLASYYASDSKYDMAIAEYQQIVVRDEKNLRALLGMASVYRVQGKSAEFAAVYKQIEGTGTEEGFVAASINYVKQKQLDEALAVVNRGLVQFPTSGKLLEVKGGVHRQLKQNTEAEQTYIKLSGIEPERGTRLLTFLYLQMQQVKKAQDLVGSALVSDAQKEYPYLLSATLSMSQQKTEEAVKVLEKGIGIVENSLGLQMQLAAIYERSSRSLQAESIYQRIIEKNQRFAPAYTALGFLKEGAGDKGLALDMYRKAIKYDRKNIAALNNAAYLLVDNFGQAKEALEFAMGAYRLKPEDPRIMDTLGYVLLKSDRPKDADNLLEKAAELLPEVADIKLHLAMAKKQLGEKKAARDLLKQVVDTGSKENEQQAEALLKTL